MNWDRMMRNAARGTDFTGAGASDEQAYFEAFGRDDGTPRADVPMRGIAVVFSTGIAFVQAAFVVK